LLRQKDLDREEVRGYLEKYSLADFLTYLEENDGP